MFVLNMCIRLDVRNGESDTRPRSTVPTANEINKREMTDRYPRWNRIPIPRRATFVDVPLSLSFSVSATCENELSFCVCTFCFPFLSLSLSHFVTRYFSPLSCARYHRCRHSHEYILLARPISSRSRTTNDIRTGSLFEQNPHADLPTYTL